MRECDSVLFRDCLQADVTGPMSFYGFHSFSPISSPPLDLVLKLSLAHLYMYTLLALTPDRTEGAGTAPFLKVLAPYDTVFISL